MRQVLSEADIRQKGDKKNEKNEKLKKIKILNNSVLISLSNKYSKYTLPIDFVKKVEYQIIVLEHDCSLMFKKLMRKLRKLRTEESEDDDIEDAVFGKHTLKFLTKILKTLSKKIHEESYVFEI